jgi:HK97 family phage prohead protease
MQQLSMEVRSLQEDQRTIMGIAVPYDATTYRVPGGEVIRRGAFLRSIQHKGGKIPLCRAHEPQHVMGYSTGFQEGDEGLEGTFRVNDGDKGDSLLADVRDGYLPSMSVCFEAVQGGIVRGADGIREVREARLVEVSLCGIPAYEGARVVSVRTAQDLDQLLAPFQNIPKWDLDPLPTLRYRSR